MMKKRLARLTSTVVLISALFLGFWGYGQSGAAVNSIAITVNRTVIGEGQNIVISAVAYQSGQKPAVGIMLHALVNGKQWGTDSPTLPSGVVHILLPLPDRGTNFVSITDGKITSNIVSVEVDPRHFHILDDPSHQIVMEYETWFGPGYAAWGKEEATPILGLYSSLDPRVLRQQALWFDEMGINIAETDWTNNLTQAFPSPAAKECIAATDLLFKVYSTMPQHPKIMFLVGPEHNLWMSRKDTYDGPWFKQQMNLLYDRYINNPKYKDMYVQYQGKPLVLYYLNGPRTVEPPEIKDPRFTIRYVGAWLQTTREEKYGVWSWYDQKPTPTYYKGEVESLTVTDGYPSPDAPATLPGMNWLSPDSGGKNYGDTYKTQWEAAMQYKPRFLFIDQWNEFGIPDQYNVNLSNDMEPTLMTEQGDPRASGWGFYYLDLTRDEIAVYHERTRSGQ